MRIAVTGSTGFLGRHVASSFADRGHLPHLLVRSGPSPNNNLPNAGTCNFDLREPPDNCYELLGEPEVLVHLAWGGLPNYDSTHHFQNELPSHFRFLDKMLKSGVQNLVVAGTCFEYGAVAGCIEEETVTNPTNCYGYAKDALRRQLEFLKSKHDYNLTWLRLFYLQGSGQGSGALIPLLDAAISRGDEKFPMSAGEQLRDYLEVGDAADILVRLSLSGCDNGAVNLCSGFPISVRRLVETRIEELKSEITPLLGALPYTKSEPMAFWGSRVKLNRILDTCAIVGQ